MSCSISTPANNAVTALLAGENLNVPDIKVDGFVVPAYVALPAIDAPDKLDISTLTTGSVGGCGVFDKLMCAIDAHIQSQHSKGRITGADYAKTYTALTESALSAALQFVMNKDQSYWAAIGAQQNAQLANAQLATAIIGASTAQAELVINLARMQNERASFALTKAKVATEEATYCTAQFNLAEILPVQKIQVQRQTELIAEQIEQAHAQTSDTRMDGVTPITGVLGTQRRLYEQQIASYKRDLEYKYLKILTDAWIAQKTLDDALVAPVSMTNASIDEVMGIYRTNAELTLTP